MLRARILPRGCPVWIACAVCCASFFWLGANARFWSREARGGWGYYGLLTESFLQGKLSLNVEPSPELKALTNPYDPQANRAYRLDDASYYQGKYYLYFGPAPVLSLLLPVRLLTGYQIPDPIAAALLASAGLVALTLLLRAVRDRHFPEVSEGYLAVIVLFLGHAGCLPQVLTRPAVWEVAIVSEVAALLAAVYLLWRCYCGQRKAAWAAAFGLAGILAIASRPTALLPVGLLYLGVGWDGEGWLRSAGTRRSAAAAGVILLAGGLGLMAYNLARFGSVLEFGQHYQLWGGIDERSVQHFSLRYCLYNLRVYFLSVPHAVAYFPFFVPNIPDPPPPGYVGADTVTGLLVAAPVLLAAGSALAWLRGARLASPGSPLARLLVVAAGGGLCSTAILLLFAGATVRYAAEMVALWGVVAGVGLMLLARSASAWARRAAIAAGIWGIVYSWLMVFSLHGTARWTAPRTYAFLAHWLDYPSAWYAEWRGIRYGPVSFRVHLDPQGEGTSVLASNGVDGLVNLFAVRRVDPRHVRFEFFVIARPYSWLEMESDPVASDSGPIEVTIDAPWLYPPAWHPYWDRIDPTQAAEHQQAFLIVAQGRGVKAYSTLTVVTRLQPTFALRHAPLSRQAWIDQLRP